MINNYNEFIIEREFQIILYDIDRIVESGSKWISDNTIEWDLTNDKDISDKLYRLLSKLSKENIKRYFYKLISKFETLPKNIKKKLIINYSLVFLSFVSSSYLFESPPNADDLDNDLKKEILSDIKRKSNFDLAQNIVKQAEAGYSSDKGDRGNWINIKTGGRRFIGTNHGISAPILAEYLGRLPKKEDMISLSYKDALRIYKSKYWDPQNLSELRDQLVANILYDGCVNQGIEGTKSVLRRSMIENGINISESDNPFDKEWIKRINEIEQEGLFNSIKKNREIRYRSAMTFKRHGSGWLNRLGEFVYGIN